MYIWKCGYFHTFIKRILYIWDCGYFHTFITKLYIGTVCIVRIRNKHALLMTSYLENDLCGVPLIDTVY